MKIITLAHLLIKTEPRPNRAEVGFSPRSHTFCCDVFSCQVSRATRHDSVARHGRSSWLMCLARPPFSWRVELISPLNLATCQWGSALVKPSVFTSLLPLPHTADKRARGGSSPQWSVEEKEGPYQSRTGGSLLHSQSTSVQVKRLNDHQAMSHT